MMNKIFGLIFLLGSFTAQSQKKDTILTKIFFEGGFEQTQVYVIGAKDTILQQTLSTDYGIGYALIFSLKNKKEKHLSIKAGKLSKKVQIREGKFYRINVRDNELIIDEVDEEPRYI